MGKIFAILLLALPLECSAAHTKEFTDPLCSNRLNPDRGLEYSLRHENAEAKTTLIDNALSKVRKTRKAGPIDVLELGPGPGHEALYLMELENDARYTAVDISPGVIDFLQRKFMGLRNQITLVRLPFSKMSLQENYFDLVVANRSLQYNPSDFPRVWELIKNSIKPGGVFAGEILGNKDVWAGHPEFKTLSVEELRNLLASDFENIELNEKFLDTFHPVRGLSTWHFIEVIARKRAI